MPTNRRVPNVLPAPNVAPSSSASDLRGLLHNAEMEERQ
jgi:hypothetical protein